MRKLKQVVFVMICALMLSVFVGCGSKVKITFEPDTINVAVNHEFTLNPVITGEGAEVVYSFDEGMFEVISEGTFKPNYMGEYYITASLKDNPDVKAEVTIKVTNGHVFDQKVTTDDYFASYATCTSKTKYYYSCTCGEIGMETFEDGEMLEHRFDQQVKDAKYADESNKHKYYYSCSCGEKGTEAFYDISPVEIPEVLADDDVAKLEPGSEYEYNGKKYTVGLTVFATINEALQYATETLNIADGEYNEEVTITKSNFKVLGNNVNIDPNIATRREESVLENKLILAEGVKNVTVSGLYFTLDAQFKCSPKGGNDDIIFEYNVFDNEITTVSGYPNGGEIMFNPGFGFYNKNFTVRNNRFLSTGGRTYHLFLTNIENLTVTGNFFEGTYVQAYVDSIIFDDTSNYGATGTIHIENNEFVNISQYGIIFWNYLDMNLEVIGNKFENCGIDGANDGYLRGAVTLVEAHFNNKKTKVLIEKNEMINVDTCVRIQYNSQTADMLEANVVNNKFISWAEAHPITNNDLGADNLIKAEYNYFGQEVSDASFKGVSSWANTYTKVEDVPSYERPNLVYIEELKITNKVSELLAYSEYRIEYSYKPFNATYTKIIFKSSDESVATVNDRGTIKVNGTGKATIYAYCVFDETIIDSFEFVVKERSMVDAYYEGNGVLKPEETVQLNTIIKGVENPGKLEFSSSDEAIATVDENGLVKAVSEGLVTITIKCGDLTTEVGFTVLAKDKEISALMQLLINNNTGTVFYNVINYIGYEVGFETVPTKVYGAANKYWAGELPELIRNMVPVTNPNYPMSKMSKIEYVVFHDTGAANPGATAEANSGWCTNATNDGTSWHYTIGNDGIYQQLEDNMIGWHAGDWSQRDPGKFAWYDTGVKYDGDRPEVTVGDDGYFYINGTKSLVEAPRKEDGSIEYRVNEVGLVCVKGENGNYKLPTTWISDESGYPICVYGGNSNGIGIESCVNSNSDLWLTWQYSAKFIAQLLIKYDLHSDRLVFHNNFTNKTCPNTMITNDLVDDFLELFYAEYAVAKEFADYEITFTSHNPEIMDNTGRIVNAPDYTTNVTYTITIAKDGVKEEVTLNALVPGRFGLK